MKRFVHILMQIFSILFVAITFVLLFIAIFKKELFENFIDSIKKLVEIWGNGNYVILFFSSFVETLPVIGMTFPGQNILLIIGWFFANISYWNLIWVIIITSIWGIIGNYIGYWMGVKWGKVFFEKYGLWFGIGETEISYLKKGIEKWWAIWITLWKFHPLTRSFLPFIAGSAGMKSKKFMFYNAIGSIVWSIIMICFGVIFAQYYQFFLEYSGTISIFILTCVVLYIYFFKKKEFLYYLQEKNAELERKYPSKK